MDVRRIEDTLAPLREKLLNHSLYKEIDSVENIHSFMEGHVFAVWDFMSLLKALQIGLTNTKLPWTPKGHPVTRKLINEIVAGEESDVNELGEPMSHYEMYLEAMQQLGANTQAIETVVDLINADVNVHKALDSIEISETARAFVHFTFDVIETGELHKIAATFTYGREDLIPDMFVEIIQNIQESNPSINMDKLVYYLQRHIEVDSGEHGPMALNMLQELCGNDEQKWNDVEEISKKALEHRIALWNGIEASILQPLSII